MARRLQKRILIVDSDSDFRTSLSKVFSRQGYRVYSAPDGQKALRLCQKHRFDLIITDLFMPLKNGFQLIKEAQILAPRCKVLVVTAYDEEENRNRALAQGAIGFLCKPVKKDQILEIVRQTLGQGEGDDNGGSKKWEKEALDSQN